MLAFFVNIFLYPNIYYRATKEDFVPQWQWTEEQRNTPVPAVVMIDE